MTAKIFLNDKVVEAGRGRIDPADAGLLHGMGLFETVRAYHGRPFRVDEHIRRLLNSAEKLGLPVRHSVRQIADATAAVIAANKWSEARLRITVTRGPVPATPADPHADECPSTLLIAGVADPGYPESLYRQGMAVAVTSVRVNPTDPTAGHKVLGYWPRLIVLQAARLAHCGEALWFTLDGRLAEGCISNVFVVRAGRLLTPPLDTPVLPGIIRAAVLEQARANGIAADERPLTVRDVHEADEVFLTNSIMEVMPVVLIERRPVGEGKPGALTKRLAELYHALVQRETAT